MPCDTLTRRGQSLQERASEVREAVTGLDALLKKRKVKIDVGPQGAVAISGWSDADRNGVTDACAYRRIMATGSTLAKLEFQRAELLAGRAIDRKVVAQGTHSHDGGQSWHGKG